MLPCERFGRPNTNSILMDSQHPVKKGKLARGAVEWGEAFLVGSLRTYAHMFSPTYTVWATNSLAYHAIGLFRTKMTTHSGVMRLIDDTILEVLVMRNRNTRRIDRICTILQQPLIDGI